MKRIAVVEDEPLMREELALMLGAAGYRGFVSIEMGAGETDAPVLSAMQRIAEVFA